MYRSASSEDQVGAEAGAPWTNRLVHETSPYLLQHAHNPVDWYPWGQEAFDRARIEDRPILLSIGYAACHWCHVMEHESFADPALAALLNEHFVAIKVDREERPDVDAIYIEALVALQGQAGWPANLFLLPDLRPFAGGTYFPPEPRYGMPPFSEVLKRVRSFWDGQRDKLAETGQALQLRLGRPPPPNDRMPDRGGFRRAVKRTLAQLDPEHGGLGGGQKFPQTPTVELLLLAASDGRPEVRDALSRWLGAMARGGLRDHLGGGFHRYCVDRAWTVPHFEKMLFDNAQLLRVYARAACVFEDEELVRVARETAHYLLTDLRDPAGAFFSSEDADDPGGEGFFYTFTAQEARDALAGARPAPATAGPNEGGRLNRQILEVLPHEARPEGAGPAGRPAPAPRRSSEPLPYGITEGGNHEGRTVLSTWAGRPPESVRQALLEARDRRPRPALDDKLVVAWNGLTIGGLAEAGRLLGFETWVDAAARCAEVLLAARGVDGTLPRLAGGRAPGTLEDQACVADGLLDLFQARPHELRWLDAALDLTRAAVAGFGSEQGGWYQSKPRADLIVRRRDFQDGAEPSGNGRMAGVLRRLLAYGAPVERALLDETLRAASGLMTGYPTATPELWSVVHGLTFDPTQAPPELVIAGAPDDPRALRMLRVWNRRWRPQGLVAFAGDGPYALLAHKPAAPDGAPLAYVCRHGTCQAPVGTAAALAAALGDS